MASCPRCGLSDITEMPQPGEVWLRVETGHLYIIEHEAKAMPGGFYGGARRIRPPQQGCDVQWKAAVWNGDVERGEWIKVQNPSAEDLRASENKGDPK